MLHTLGYNVLVATDAIGMGLNLSIKRIIFSSLQKYDGRKDRYLTSHEVKQIAGRAGRYNTHYPEGYVMCLHDDDSKHMFLSLSQPDRPIYKVGGWMDVWGLLLSLNTIVSNILHVIVCV